MICKNKNYTIFYFELFIKKTNGNLAKSMNTNLFTKIHNVFYLKLLPENFTVKYLKLVFTI